MSNQSLEFETSIRDLSRAGTGVGLMPDGRTVFIPLTAPGDRVRARVKSEEKNYALADLIEVLTPSPERETPRCPVFGRCGGCEWQHLPYALQWATKTKGVLHALARVGLGAVAAPELFPAPSAWNYRNRIQVRGRNGEVGFYGRGTRDLVVIDSCPIARAEVNAALGEARNACRGQDLETKIEIDVDPTGRARVAVNRKHGAFGFRQVNDAQNEALKSWVKAHTPKGLRVLDLFGGDGNLSRGLDSPAIDVVDFGKPGDSSPGMTFHRAPVLSWLVKQSKTATPSPCTAILDPPREGIRKDAPEILASLETLGATSLVLVGCEPDSWASVLAVAAKRGWQIQSFAIFDLFPQTHHVETAAHLIRN